MTHHGCGAVTYGTLCPCETCKNPEVCGCRASYAFENAHPPTERPAVHPGVWKGILAMLLFYAAVGVIGWCLFVTVQRARGDDRPLTPDVVKLDTGLAAPKYADNRDDALDELNEWRRRNGYPPFIRDEGLTIAARGAAKYRAEHFIFGHVMHGAGDFQFLPKGTNAAAAGCAAYPASYGWLSCCMRDSAKYAGAAWWPGADGKRYMHVFVR